MQRCLCLLFLSVLALPANAHFIFIVPEGADGTRAKVVFSDDLEPDEAVSIKKIAATKLMTRDVDGKTAPLTWELGKHEYLVTIPGAKLTVVGGSCQYGVLQKGDAKPFLLSYHPKMVRGDVRAAKAWDQLPLEIVAVEADQLQVLYAGKPLAGAEVIVVAPAASKQKLTTDPDGRVKIKVDGAGLYAVRAKHVDAKPGELDGKQYAEARHYATLVFRKGDAAPKKETSAAPAYSPLPEGFSSFGAAVSEGYVYVYGGHVAKTHSYSTDAVTGKFRRLSLTAAGKGWEELPAGPALQGLALVAHGGKLYRIGGMQPRNKPGDKADNHSVASCAVYDPRIGTWQALPDMPNGRSSHDAVVVGSTIVVAGGWQMHGQGKKSEWLNTTLLLDLAKAEPKWEAIAQPFERRALNMGTVDGKVYVVCGMGADNTTAKTIDILDVATRKWSQGPQLPGPARNGFSPAVCTSDAKLYVSPSDGRIYQLSGKGDSWQEVGTVQQPRIVHRIVPVRAGVLLVLGGAARGDNIALVEEVQPTAFSSGK